MSFNSIIVGVDPTPASVAAAETGARIAQAAGAACRLVHGSRLLFDPPATAEFLSDVELLVEHHLARARGTIVDALRGSVSEEYLASLEVRLGQPAGVVGEVAHERQADLVIVGGKHHTPLARWIGGSTALHLVRSTDVPLLVVVQQARALRRVLMAVDLSYALQPTVRAAMRLARLFDAEVRVLHVVEPLPAVAELPVTLSDEAFVADSEAQLARALESLTDTVVAGPVLRRGPAAPTIVEEATAWNADVVVVGSHGKGWMHRLLVGSVTEQLLNALPTSLLVVPTTTHSAGSREKTAKTPREREDQIVI